MKTEIKDLSKIKHLIGKKILFYPNATMDDVKHVYYFLVVNGFLSFTQKWGEYLNNFLFQEMEEMLDLQNNLYFDLKINAVNPQGLVAEIDYGYSDLYIYHDGTNSLTELLQNSNWISYREILKLADINYFPLTESTMKNLNPKKGDLLYCHTDLIMDEGNNIEATNGKTYEVTAINGSELEIINNSDGLHVFDLINHKERGMHNSYYEKWFTLIPKDYFIDTEKIFNDINEL